MQQQLREREAALKETLARSGCDRRGKGRRPSAAWRCCCTPPSTTRPPSRPTSTRRIWRLDEPRWPHLLHYLHKSRGAPGQGHGRPDARARARARRRAGARSGWGACIWIRARPTRPSRCSSARSGTRRRAVAGAAGPGTVGAGAQGLRARRQRARGGAARGPVGGQRALAAGDGLSGPGRHRARDRAPAAVAQHRGAGARSGRAWSWTCRCRAGCRSSCAACARWRRATSRPPSGFFRQGVKLTDGGDARSGGRCATSWARRCS